VTFSNGNTVVRDPSDRKRERRTVPGQVLGEFASGTSTTQTVTNTVVASDVTFTQGTTTVHPTAISRPISTPSRFITKNYLSNAFA